MTMVMTLMTYDYHDDDSGDYADGGVGVRVMSSKVPVCHRRNILHTLSPA